MSSTALSAAGDQHQRRFDGHGLTDARGSRYEKGMHPPRPRGPAQRQATPDSFEEFQASALFCPRCRVAQPVRERVLLYLPDGQMWEYVCSVCGTSLGTRRSSAAPGRIVS